MDAIAALFIAATIVKVTDLLRYAKGKQYGAVATQVVVWLVAIGLVALVAHADIFAGFKIQGFYLAKANFASLVVVGLIFGSGGSLAKDIMTSVDNTQSAAIPKLFD